MNAIKAYRGFSSAEELLNLQRGVVSGQWYSTNIMDAINFAKKDGVVIEVELYLHEDDEDEYCFSFGEKHNHKGWGLRDEVHRLGSEEGEWYYLDQSYLDNVCVFSVMTKDEAWDLEEILNP